MTSRQGGVPARRWHRVVEHPLLILASLILGILASVATIMGDFWPPNDGRPQSGVASAPQTDGSPGVTSDSSAGTASVEDNRSRTVSPADVTVGACLAADQIVACDQSHDSEVIERDSAVRCDRAALFGYLGGSAGIDVLHPGIQVARKPVRGREVCLATVGAPIEATMRDAFTRSDHEQWRWCLETKRRQVTVDCTAPHDAEVTAVRASTEPIIDCRGAATVYTGTNWRNLEKALTAKTSKQNGQNLCFLESLGDTQIHGSLRGVGTRSLPIEPRRG